MKKCRYRLYNDLFGLCQNGREVFREIFAKRINVQFFLGGNNTYLEAHMGLLAGCDVLACV